MALFHHMEISKIRISLLKNFLKLSVLFAPNNILFQLEIYANFTEKRSEFNKIEKIGKKFHNKTDNMEAVLYHITI